MLSKPRRAVLGLPGLFAAMVWMIPGGVGYAGVPRDLPAFPGAEGFGSHTPGGRGGRIIEVTTLASEGSGSLRAALTATGPRIVVFRVGGTIGLTRNLVLDQPFITVAGQTAP